MGALKAEDSDVYTIDTSILGIHQFLVNFFKFYLCNLLFLSCRLLQGVVPEVY